MWYICTFNVCVCTNLVYHDLNLVFTDEDNCIIVETTE